MKFYYENTMCDSGYFYENDLIKAIFAAWNIDANLYLLNDGIKKINKNESFYKQAKLIFAPYEENDFNTEILKEFGYKMEDREPYREIIDIKTNDIVKYDWSEVIQLV